MPLGQLVDEAELAVVVAGADRSNTARLDLDAERLAARLGTST
jgi:4-hydroxy-3-methylbut-2-enyl diphosphate reductase IspH